MSLEGMQFWKKRNPEAGTKRAVLSDLTDDLAAGAHSAYEMKTLDGRTEKMAQTVARESVLSFKETHKNNPLLQNFNFTRLEDIFYKAAKQAGDAFVPSFNPDGTKNADQEALYNAAQKAAGRIALSHMDEIAQLFGEANGAHIKDNIEAADFGQVCALVAKQLNVPPPTAKEPDAIRAILKDPRVVDEKDYFRDQIGNITMLPHGHEEKLSDIDELLMDVSVRLANVTWKAGQVHRAHWEGTTKRVDPKQSEVFAPFDTLKRNQYERVKKEMGEEAALYRVAYEVWKDMIQLKGKK